jgi:hypothetical protein
LRSTTAGRTTTWRALAVTPRAATGYRCAPMTTLRRLLLATLLLMSLAAPAAQAAHDQVSIIMDDDQLLYRGDRISSHTLVTARSLGAEVVRATILWRVAADGARLSNKEIERLKTKTLRDRARAQRRRFKPTDPRTYPTRNWDRYDNLVKEAAQLGMRVYFTITGPGPSYAHRLAPPSQRANAGTYKPIPTRFRAFVQAVGTRYSGRYRDENGIRKALPRVALWSLWNEPNQPGWLSPQWENGVPASPALYRELYHAGHQGLELSGHGNDVILLGETSPLGSPLRGPRNGIRPVPFLRELVCVAPNGTQYTGPAATARHCDDFARFGPLKASAYAHHPYTKKGAPTIKPSVPDEITIANIGTLGPLLDTLSAQSGGKIASGLPLLLTEFGYESDPPDPRLQPAARRGHDAVPHPRRGAADAVPRGLAAVLVHLPVGPLRPQGLRQAGGVRLHVPARHLQPRRSRHDRVLGSAALPAQRLAGRRGRLLASDGAQREEGAVRARQRLDAAGAAVPDDVPRLLQRHVPDAGTGRVLLRRLPRPDEGQDHPPLADDDAVAGAGQPASGCGRFGARLFQPRSIRATKRFGERL